MKVKEVVKKVRRFAEPFRITNGKKFHLKDVNSGDTLIPSSLSRSSRTFEIQSREAEEHPPQRSLAAGTIRAKDFRAANPPYAILRSPAPPFLGHLHAVTSEIRPSSERFELLTPVS
jgi:hypothetical protein